MTAIQAGFTSVMMDGSLKADGKTAADWDYNVGVTKTVTDMAHLGGISVEGEAWRAGFAGNRHGRQGGRPRRRGQTVRTTQLLTNPTKPSNSSKQTKVDALAIAMGTSHGAYKFTRKPDGDILAMNVIEEIHRKLPNMHLVMHGSSSVPPGPAGHHQRQWRQDESDLGRAGLRIQRGIKNGVRKINIDTDNRWR